MSFLDVCIALIIGYNAIIGFRKGFLRIVSDVIAFLGGALIGVSLAPTFSIFLENSVGVPQSISSVVGFCIIWVTIFLCVEMVSKLISKVLEISIFGLFNKFGGLGAGTIKGMLIVVPLLMPFVYLNSPMLVESTLLPPFRPALNHIMQKFMIGSEKLLNENTEKVSPDVKKRNKEIKNELDALLDNPEIIEKLRQESL